MTDGESKPAADQKRRPWDGALLLAWLAGALAPQALFQLEKKLGNGNFGYNIVLSALLLILGSVLVVGLLRLARRFMHSPAWKHLLRIASPVLLGAGLLFSLAPFLPKVPFGIYWVGVAALGAWIALVLVALALALATQSTASRGADRNADPTNRATPPRSRSQRGWSFNGAFWLLVFLLLLALNLWSLDKIADRTGFESLLLIAGRVLTLATFTLAAFLISQALLALFPAPFHWVALSAIATLPVILLADFAAGVYWQQSLLDVLNSFTLAGRFDATQLLEAAGIRNSPVQILFLLLGVVGLSLLAYLGLQKLSSRVALRTSTRTALTVFTALWLATVGQQALSMVALRKATWQAEHSVFKIHLGLLRPDPGYETIPVRFVEHLSGDQADDLLAGELPVLARKPDIYLVIVETWRADSLTPEIAPFLDQFRREECQQFETTVAGSNCTPVSWFTIFHSRLGIHWKEAVARENGVGGLRGSYPIRLLHALGYQHSIRAVCDLGYQKMADLSFGADHHLAGSFLDNPMLPRGLEIPEREVIVVDDLKEQLLATPVGGALHFLSLDSPHYNYYWPEDKFKPLHTDCAGNINYASLNPSPEDIREVVKRYENSVHWIDQQMKEFVAFLKERGRYDDSIIIITGDHGEEFQEHGSWFHCSNLKRPQTAVPILIKWPGWVRNQPAQAQASHLDIMPSVLDALGLDDKYFADLAGRSLLREHSGEAVISTLWAGVSGIGVCFVKDGLKANFAASKLWLGTVPSTLYFMGYADPDDNPLDPVQIRGDLRDSQFLRQTFPDVTNRFFGKFGTVQP